VSVPLTFQSGEVAEVDFFEVVVVVGVIGELNPCRSDGAGRDPACVGSHDVGTP
jgi:hypothetical protein